MIDEQVRRHCREIDRCNQRGGRMLSIVDLIDAETVPADLAAWAAAAIGRGASFLVGALPGGAGKTTVMGALLNFVGPDVELVAADGPAAIERGLAEAAERRCYICHEIGSGPYYAYLWGAELRAYFELPAAGGVLATNLHADTYEQARSQICDDNGVGAVALRRMGLMFFLSVGRGGLRVRRRIASVWATDGDAPHGQVYADGAGLDAAAAAKLAPPEDAARARETIEQLRAAGSRTIEEVRAAVCAARTR